MKVRQSIIAVFAASALASQGVAQQSEDSLERALAELNSGLAAPNQGGSVMISGDFRARNRWFDDGNETNNRDIDTRIRLNFEFHPNESATAFVGFSGREAFGGTAVGRWDVGTGEGLDRAWVSVNSLVGDGGDVKIGRSYYTLGNGRLIGSEEWDNLVTTFSGIWYTHPAAGFNVHGAMLNGVENGLTASDDMVYVLGFNYVFDMIEACGDISLDPWFLRDETASGGAAGGTHETWYGVDLGGNAMGIGWEFDFAKYEYDGLDLSGTAWYVGADVQLDQLESIPGIASSSINVAISDSDEEFNVPGEVVSGGTAYGVRYHNAVGFADVLGSSGIWTTDTDTWKVGVGISPAEGWNGGLSLMNIESAGMEWDEIDVSLGTQLNGNVSAWFGYAWIDPNAADNESVFWTTLDLAFGG